MTPRLVATGGSLQGQTHDIVGDRFVIGRHRDCDLQLEILEVSRRHCEIVVDEDRQFHLRDLGSRHGTLVNSRPIRGEILLEHTDCITLGTLSFLFLIDDSRDQALRDTDTGSLPVLRGSLERKPTETLHLDPARVEAALPTQARLARELHTLLRLAQTLQEHTDIPALAAHLLNTAVQAIPATERASVWLREPGLERPICVASRGAGTAQISGTVLDRVLRDGVAICCPRVEDDADLGGAASVVEVGALLAAPLVGPAEPLGLIYLDRSTHGFTEHHLELLTAIAGVASPALQNTLHLRWLEGENRRLRDEAAAHHDMIGESAPMRHLFDLVARVARADSTVLIHGESGTGKELVARAIHRTSPRADGPFVAVNCATLSENLLESELFGHEKGAFTGASGRKMGKMEAAHRGTLFLDEVAEIPIQLQAKLLRALQEREIERLGGTRPITVDVRVVAASHRDLQRAVGEGRFRGDLYFRLKVITLELPALRERRDDIPLLARHFTHRHGAKLGVGDMGIAPEARRCLLAYDWPGNVRELGNVIERAVVLGDGEVVRREDLPDEIIAAASHGTEAPTAATAADHPTTDPLPADTSTDFQEALTHFKKRFILDAWRAVGEDYGLTAERLGIHVNSLHRMVKNLGLKADLGR